MKESIGLYSASARHALKPAVLTSLLLALLLATLGAPGVGAQGDGPLSDAEIASALEPVVLSETVTDIGLQVLVELPAQQDTYVSSNYPDSNFGLSTSLRIGYNQTGWAPQGALRPYMQFNLSSIPAGVVINRAEIRAYQYLISPAGDSGMNVVSRQLNSSWNESLVTWNNNRPDWGSIFDSGPLPGTLGWQTQDVTGVVREWYTGAHANNGIIFLGDERVQERQRFFYSLNANNGLYPRLVVDYTVSTDSTPPTASVNPLPQWSPASFTVSWSGSDNPGGTGIAYYDVQYNENGGSWIDGLRRTTTTSVLFTNGANGVTYQFRARAVDKANNYQAWTAAQAQTTVDTIPPTAAVDPLPEYTPMSSFTVTWSGTDNPGGSGLARYDVQYRTLGGAWVAWIANTTGTSAQFTGAQDGVTYEFRARGTDHAGNQQSWGDAQAWTTIVLHPIAVVLPFSPPTVKPTDPITDSFVVEWAGFHTGGTTISAYNVRYRFNKGPWQDWTTTTQNSAVFDIPFAEDGVYDFEASATDNLGRSEPFAGVPEASKIVDLLPPFIELRVRFPLVLRNH